MLSIDDVTGKTFAKVRRGDGYDIREVDTFRAEVAEAISARETVIDRLREELDVCQRELDAATGPHDIDVVRREASGAAARLLEIATANADQLVNDARSEAERRDAELARRHEQEIADFELHRAGVLAELEEQRSALGAQVEDLLQLEREHRERLRRHLTEHLARLDDMAAVH